MPENDATVITINANPEVTLADDLLRFAQEYEQPKNAKMSAKTRRVLSLFDEIHNEVCGDPIHYASKAAKAEADSEDRSVRYVAALAEVRIKGAEWEKILTSPEKNGKDLRDKIFYALQRCKALWNVIAGGEFAQYDAVLTQRLDAGVRAMRRHLASRGVATIEAFDQTAKAINKTLMQVQEAREGKVPPEWMQLVAMKAAA